MTAAATLQSRAVVRASEAQVLERITDADTHLALWFCTRPDDLAWLDDLAVEGLPDLSFPCSLEELDTAIPDGLAEAGYPGGAHSEALSREIAMLARRFAAVLGCAAVKIRLEVIRTDACRKFHSDYVPARLITTLAGPGTQWIEADKPETIHQMRTGEVGIFKGRLLAPEPAILHRSVPLSAIGGTRLLLVLDPVSDAKTTA